MDSALVGLLGVILGGLLTMFTTQRMESQRRRKLAHAAALAIDDELEAAATAVRASTEKYDPAAWMNLRITTDKWDNKSEALASELSPKAYRKLSEAYSSIEVINASSTASDGSLRSAGKTIVEAQGYLKEDVNRILKSRGIQRALPVWIAVMVVAAVVAILAIPRYVVTPATVGAQLELALEAQHNANYSVDCDPYADDWKCYAEKLDFVCPTAVSTGAAGDCPNARAELDVSEQEGGRQLVRNVGPISNAAFFGVSTTIPETQEPLFKRIVCGAFGVWCESVFGTRPN